jgi:hypothetical protein
MGGTQTKPRMSASDARRMRTLNRRLQLQLKLDLAAITGVRPKPEMSQ